ncbi:MAG: transposase [Gammaproteobacteria bacterium]|nr:transposase [Gammaproteobacteria bacterium]
MAKKRRRFTPEFKARVALEALRERDSVQAIARRHKLHPNQVSTWKRQLLDAVPEVFAQDGRPKLAREHEVKVHDLHAKIGELTVERDFFRRGSGTEPGGADADDRAGWTAEPVESVRAAGRETGSSG